MLRQIQKSRCKTLKCCGVECERSADLAVEEPETPEAEAEAEASQGTKRPREGEEAAAADQLSPVFSPRDLDRPPGFVPPAAKPPDVDSTLTLGPNAGSAGSSRPRRNSVAPTRFVEIKFEQPYKRSDRGQERPARSSSLAPLSPALRQALGPCVRSGWSQVGWQSLLQEHTGVDPRQ